MNWTSTVLFLTLSSSVLARRVTPLEYNPYPCRSALEYRLSGNVRPTFYSIKIHPDIDKETFTGEVFMHLKVETSVSSIEFHSSNLTITSLYLDTEEEFHNTHHCSLDFAFEYVKPELIKIFRHNKKLIPPGAHVVHIKYNGRLSKTKKGFFKSGVSKNGTILTHLLATDFQTTKARQVFPCFDEPKFKARYQLDVVVPNSSYVALSNMRVMDKFEISDGIVYKFEPTPLMSIYLLSFVITQHTYVEYIDANNILFRIYCCHAHEENNTELLEFTSEVIRFYTVYTNFSYPLPKIDLVEYDRTETAATENWGLVTFNTSLLCLETDFYDLGQKKGVITHEIAHFWFGNLVTNQWWDDIWLQESFATFMATKAQNYLEKNPSINLFTDLDNVFWMEMNEISTPVVHFQEEPPKIRKNFNDITYIKGAAILDMIELVIGEQKMRDVIREYIRKFAYKTVTTPDLVAIVSDIGNDINLREFMETYLYQSRFPIISIVEEEDAYVIRQTTFVPKVMKDTPSQFGYKWTIPLTYITDLNDAPSTVWFQKDVEKLILPKKNATWIKLNYHQISYYRVNYGKSLWESLMLHIQDLERTERNNLAIEAMSLFELELSSCDLVLKYLWHLSNSSSLDSNIGFTIYWKLDTIIQEYDDEASLLLKDFFDPIFWKFRKQRMAKCYFKNSLDKTKKKKKNVPEKVESCIQWILNESAKLYNATSEDKIETNEP